MTPLAECDEVLIVAVGLVPVQMVDGKTIALLGIVEFVAMLTAPSRARFDIVRDLFPVERVVVHVSSY
jgi:hypothetical protein